MEREPRACSAAQGWWKGFTRRIRHGAGLSTWVWESGVGELGQASYSALVHALGLLTIIDDV